MTSFQFYKNQSFEKIFPEVVGNYQAKLALILNLIEPRCGGVLLIGKKGTGKSLLLKCFKKLLKIIKQPYVEIPLNVTEEMLIGGIDVEKTIEKGFRVYEAGLLERARNRFILIDDINLFPEEYLSLIFEKIDNYTLIGTLNPEEGFLSLHFFDKIGMCVMTETLRDLNRTAKIFKTQENFSYFETLYINEYEELGRYLKVLKVFKEKINIKEELLDKISEKVLKEFAFSHRSEIFLYYASLAFTAFKRENYVRHEHIDYIAPLVLIHRKREIREEPISKEKEKKNQEKDIKEYQKDKEEKQTQRPFQKDENVFKTEKEKNKKEDLGPLSLDTLFTGDLKEEVFRIGEIFKPKRFILKKDRIVRDVIGRRTKSKTILKGGRFLRSVIFSKDRDIDIFGTIRAAAPFQKLRKGKNRLVIYKEDLRYKEKERKISHLVIFLVDGSGSMGVQKRMEAVKGAIFSLLTDCYQKRDKVSMIMFRKDKAEIILPPTSSVELAYKKLKDLPTGGKTPLSLGLLEVYKFIKKFNLKYPRSRIILVVLSDGKANVSIRPDQDPLEETKRICYEIKNLDYVDKIVVDCEIKNNFLKMDLARDIAEWLEAYYLFLEDLKAENLISLINEAKSKIN